MKIIIIAGSGELLLNQWDLFALVDKGLEKMRANFPEIPNISFDYAVVEKSRQMVMLPLTAEYSDIGSGDVVYDMLEKDPDGNVIQGAN